MDVQEFREFGKAAVDYIADYFEAIRDRHFDPKEANTNSRSKTKNGNRAGLSLWCLRLINSVKWIVRVLKVHCTHTYRSYVVRDLSEDQTGLIADMLEYLIL
ncbi:hypothetical protein NQ317_009304 [Molorchus minor]|uniref:Uncharacterized protein n=1 Tax=Molorchus minor TaxID=1323400 RepID=A0ABQ9J6W2_9CUCU|nr:hypothetical protein NQ317_009304 [Molorchus minor]